MIDRFTLRYSRPGEILAAGTYLNSKGEKTMWVAVRGVIADWAIYTGPAEWGAARIASFGDKVYNEALVRQFVQVTDEALMDYRWH